AVALQCFVPTIELSENVAVVIVCRGLIRACCERALQKPRRLLGSTRPRDNDRQQAQSLQVICLRLQNLAAELLSLPPLGRLVQQSRALHGLHCSAAHGSSDTPIQEQTSSCAHTHDMVVTQRAPQ